jgi:hypothetical protein
LNNKSLQPLFAGYDYQFFVFSKMNGRTKGDICPFIFLLQHNFHRLVGFNSAGHIFSGDLKAFQLQLSEGYFNDNFVIA